MKIRTGILSFVTGAAALVLGVAPTMGVQAAGPAVAVFSGSASATVQFSGGTGTFGFTSNACVGADAGTTQVGLCSVTASGSFNNTVCGTGTADGTATVTEAGGAQLVINFHIQFVASVGIVTGPGLSASVVGVVQISPNSPAPPPGCTAGFTVTTADVIP